MSAKPFLTVQKPSNNLSQIPVDTLYSILFATHRKYAARGDEVKSFACGCEGAGEALEELGDTSKLLCSGKNRNGGDAW